MAVYKDLIISTIVDMARFNLNDYVYKDLIISTIVDIEHYAINRKNGL